MSRSNETKIKVTATVEIAEHRLADMLCCAFEGGYSPWCRIEKYRKPRKVWSTSDGDWPEKNPYRHIQYPLSKGGGLLIRDMEDDEREPIWLTRDRVLAGLQIMAEKEPRHFADLLNENDDAITGDVFLQCCVFGEAIYG